MSDEENIMKKKNNDVGYLCTYCPIEIIKMIEKNRGDISKSLFVRRAVIQALREAGEIIEIEKR
jgi:hypothetical protein